MSTHPVSEDEVLALHRQFQQMLEKQPGSTGIGKDDFQKSFGLGNFEGTRLFNVFSNKSSSMTFEQLCRGMSAFSPNADGEEKIEASFKFFDINGDGRLDQSELHDVFEQFLKDNNIDASHEMIDAIVLQTFRGFGVYEDRGDAAATLASIDYDMYKEMVAHHPNLISAMTISTWQLLL